jgi:NAD(P)-dependent dehydrogenase (short-subunit alcohol dehydrogenase family)
LSSRAHTLVIGGSKGIGRTLVRSLAGDGQAVSVISRSKPAGLGGLPLVESWTADVADASALDTALAAVSSARGPVSGAVLLQRYRGDGDDWAGELATSLTATRSVLEWVGEHGQFSGAGTAVVVIGSAAGAFIASEQPVSYHVAKAGITQMVRYYAVALGPKGVRVNSISPGTIVKEESQSFYESNPELERLYRDIIPLGRMGTARDVADLAMFLLSDRASFLTGQNIVLDGGVSLHWHEALARRVSPLKDLNVARPARRKS